MNMVRFSKEQFHTLSDYFSDISKILAGSGVIGFFIPMESIHVTPFLFVASAIAAGSFLLLSVAFAK